MDALEVCGVMGGAHAWDHERWSDTIKLMIDTGASTHMTNTRQAFIHGTIETCDIQVMGVGGTLIHITERGSVPLCVGGRQHVLSNVLLHTHAHLGAGPVDEPQVLVGVRQFAADTGLGLCFPADGKTMNVMDGELCIATAETRDSALYVVDRRDLEGKATDRENVRVFLSVPSGQQGNASITHKPGEVFETANVFVSFSNSERGKTKHETMGNTTRILTTTDPDGTRSEFRDFLDTPTDVSTDLDRSMKKVGVAVLEVGDKSEKRKPRFTTEQRKVFGRLIHKRMHHGHSSNVMSALSKAYGDRYIQDDEPCEACMWAKARMKTRSKTHRREAKHLGDRLLYDLFHGPSRSEEGFKYVLIVIDEHTSRSWSKGLKKKSDLYEALEQIIREVETKMRGGRVISLATDCSDVPHVVEIRSDNAKENIVKRMRELCARNGTKMETSVPYQQWQNGKAERLGGHIMKGGRALQFGGCLPERDWFKCVNAFNHIRNRTPNTNSAKHDGRTPYELWHDIDTPLIDQLDHLRVLGSLCYVVIPDDLVRAGGKKSYKAVVLGYAEEREPAQKGYIVRRLSDGWITTGTYAQTHVYEHLLPYHKKDDDDVDERGDAHDGAYELSESTESDREVSDIESADSVHLDQELDIANRKGAIDDSIPLNNESDSGDDASWGSNTPMVRSIDCESKHDGTGNAQSAVTDSHDPVDIDEERMKGVRDKLRDIERDVKARPSHNHKLRQRPQGLSKREDKRERKEREPLGSVSEEGMIMRKSKPRPSPRKERVPQYELQKIVDVARMGKKGNGGLVFRVLWETGDKTWEKMTVFDGGGEQALKAFFNTMTRKQIILFKANEIDEMMTMISNDSDHNESDGERDEPHESVRGKARRKERMKEKFDVLKAVIAQKNVVQGEKVPASLAQAKKHSKWNDFAADMIVEFENFNKKGVWRLVPRPKDANVVSVRWLFAIKEKNGVITRYKARLVCRGFNQKEGEDYDPNELYAPTMKTKTLRALTALAAKHGWDMNQYDVSCAFLHADLEETVYVEQPPEHVVPGREDWVYVLDKAMYGLKQSPRAFSKHLAKCYKTLGFKQSDADECLWVLRKEHGVVIYALYHVDDIIMMSNNNESRDEIFRALRMSLDIRDEGHVDVFLNMKFEYGSDGSISLSQSHYIEKVAKRFGVTVESVKTPGSPDEVLSKDDLPVSDEEQQIAAKLPYPALVGCLIYANLTRPDVAYSISNVAMYMSRWGVRHYEHAIRILKYLYTTRNDKITYHKWDGDVELTCFVDANYGDGRDSGNNDKWCSQGGYLVYVGDCLVSWSSKRHRCRTLSSMEAEYVEAARGGQEIVWFRRLMNDLGYPQLSPTVMWEDNKAAIAFSKNQTCHDRSKHIDIRVYWLRDLVVDGAIVMMHIPTDEQLADFLTKHLRAPQHTKATGLVLGGRPLGRNKGESVKFVAKLSEFLDDERTQNTYHKMFMVGGVDCY